MPWLGVDVPPSGKKVKTNPTTSKDLYKNHCAIKVGEALLNAGISLKSFTGGECQYCPRTDGQRHPLLAQALAKWLSQRPFPGCSAPLKSDGAHYEKDFDDKTGIIFFADYWQREGETGEQRSGDHIDLWDDKTLASIGTFESFVRVNVGFSIDGWFSDFGKAKHVLFWEIK